MSPTLNRRKFLQMSALGAVGLVISGRVKPTTAAIQSQAASLTRSYSESPTLNRMTSAGIIPAVNDRLPKVPLVLTPIDGVKIYGGSIHTFTQSSWPGGNMEESQYGHSPLRWIKDGLEIAPGMCDAWSTNANNTQWTVHIREGLKWSDGVPVTVDDILFWWNDLVNANYPGGPDDVPDFGYDGVRLATFTKVDDFTLTISYTNPAPLTVYRLAMWAKGNIGPRWIAPAHYLKQFHPKYSLNYPDCMVLTVRILFRINPACPSLDPWICSQYSPGDQTHPVQITWGRNPYYYAVDPDGNQLPYIDEWIEDGIDDRQTQLSQVKAGQVDFLHFHSFLLGDIPNLQGGQAQGNYALRLLDSGSGTGMIYYWNYDHPDPIKRMLYRTPKFKQAMSLALNRPLIQTSIYQGYGMQTTGTMSPKAYEFIFNDEAKSRFTGYRDAFVAYDPVQARALLDSINVKDVNADTWREYPDGTPLSIFVDVPDDATEECMAVLSIALQNWRAVGLNVQSNIIPAYKFDWQSGQGDIHTNWTASDGPNHLIYPGWMVPIETDRWAPLCGRTFQYRGTPWENTQCDVDPWARTPPRYCSTDSQYAGSIAAQMQQILLQAEVEPDLLKRIQYVWQILDIHKTNVFYLGTVANTPHIEIVSQNLRNVPTREQMALGGFTDPWIIPYPAITNPETWSFAHQMFLPMTKK